LQTTALTRLGKGLKLRWASFLVIDCFIYVSTTVTIDVFMALFSESGYRMHACVVPGQFRHVEALCAMIHFPLPCCRPFVKHLQYFFDLELWSVCRATSEWSSIFLYSSPHCLFLTSLLCGRTGQNTAGSPASRFNFT